MDNITFLPSAADDFQFPSVYQEYIALSRYARYDNTLQRREEWPETCDRVVSFWKQRFPKLDKQIFSSMHQGMLGFEVMPSMRSVMTAGPALDRDNVASFNCSYAPITGGGETVSLWDSKLEDLGFDEPIQVKLRTPIVFDELLYILLCGTGVGFSVERQYISELPTVGRKLARSIYKRTKKNYPKVDKDELSFFDRKTNTVQVADSKYGWASALRIWIVELYNGNFDVKYDTSAVRAAGEVLRTFGGRASGPKALEELLDKIKAIFEKALGRKLTSMECHDIMCLIGDAVVVGGVRRSALISLSNLSDERMRYAKSGEWWVTEPQRALSNNSVAYTDKPSIGPFMREWQALYESKSGERGFYNRVAAQKKAMEIGREVGEFGVNPCFAPGTLIHTSKGHFPIEDLVGKVVDVWDGNEWRQIDNFRITGTNQRVFKLTLQDGSEIVATPYHTFITEDGDRVELKDLEIGTRLLASDAPMVEGAVDVKGAYLKGFLLGDGTSSSDRPILYLYDTKYGCEERLVSSCDEIPISEINTNAITNPSFENGGTQNRKRLTGLACRKKDLYEWTATNKHRLPTECLNWSPNSKAELLAGLFDADGCALDGPKGFGYQLCSIHKEFLLGLQQLLKTMGVKSKVALSREGGVKDFGEDGGGEYYTHPLYRLSIAQVGAVALSNQVTFSRLVSFADRSARTMDTNRFLTVVDISGAGVEDKVYCCTVPTTNSVAISVGALTGQCVEINLNPNQFCNLSEIVVRAGDTIEDLMRKARIATWWGTLQSTLTDFAYLSASWKETTERERLLGVSMTGVMDHEVLSKVTDEAKLWLKELRQQVKKVNEEAAAILGIPASAARTCVKPSGTVSQLVNSGSGRHQRWGIWYIRTVRQDAKDPLAQVMIEQGFPYEEAIGKPGTLVFSFPVKSPEHAVLRDDMTAIEQLEHHKMFYENYCDHNPSSTIYVEEDEWMQVGSWVYDNFDDICGLSFLPKTDHIYAQAPYQEITEAEYEELVAKMPTSIDHQRLQELEGADYTTGMQEYACVSGQCEL